MDPHSHRKFIAQQLREHFSKLAVSLRRISETARNVAGNAELPEVMRNCQHQIESFAAEVEPEIAVELVDIQRMLGFWRRVWIERETTASLRTLLYLQARQWALQVEGYSAH